MNAHSSVYPDVPGHRGTDTSIAAATAIAPVSARIQRMVLLAIAEVGSRGLTAEELATRLSMERTTVQPRTTELRRRGLIDDSGQRRRNRNGKSAIVWTAVISGETARG